MANKSIGAFWEYMSKSGKKYWKGNIDGKKYIMYENGYKEKDTQPDLKVYLDVPKEEGYQGAVSWSGEVDPF